MLVVVALFHRWQIEMYRLIIMKIDFAAEIVCSIQFCNNALLCSFHDPQIGFDFDFNSKSFNWKRHGFDLSVEALRMRGICVFIVCDFGF